MNGLAGAKEFNTMRSDDGMQCVHTPYLLTVPAFTRTLCRSVNIMLTPVEINWLYSPTAQNYAWNFEAALRFEYSCVLVPVDTDGTGKTKLAGENSNLIGWMQWFRPKQTIMSVKDLCPVKRSPPNLCSLLRHVYRYSMNLSDRSIRSVIAVNVPLLAYSSDVSELVWKPVADCRSWPTILRQNIKKHVARRYRQQSRQLKMRWPWFAMGVTNNRFNHLLALPAHEGRWISPSRYRGCPVRSNLQSRSGYQ